MQLYLLSTLFSITRGKKFLALTTLSRFLSLVSKYALTHILTLALLTWFFFMYCWTACKPLPRSVCMASGSRSWTHAWRGYKDQVKGRMHPRTSASQLNCNPPAQHLRPFLTKEPGHLFGHLSCCAVLFSALKPASGLLTSVLGTGRSCVLQLPSLSLSRFTGTLPSCLNSRHPLL